MSRYINQDKVIDAVLNLDTSNRISWRDAVVDMIDALPSAQPERLTDDDFETIRIHLNAYKENLCNQRRWEEAEEYQRIIDRFMAFTSADVQPVVHGEWIGRGSMLIGYRCSVCDGYSIDGTDKYCPNCGAKMDGKGADE